MTQLLLPAAVILGPILLVALVGLVRRSAPFRLANVFKLYLTMLFGFFGVYGHILHPRSVVDLIPPVFPGSSAKNEDWGPGGANQKPKGEAAGTGAAK